MENIQINKINSLIEAIYYHNLILENDEIILDFRKATFVRNNYLSIIGLALEKLKQKDGIYEIKLPLNRKVLKSMRDVEFLDKFTFIHKGVDKNKTMIKYTNITDNEYENLHLFYEYFRNKLLGKIQNISAKLANKIMQKVFELFSNVFRHSQSELGLFCSGQFYPLNNKFYFTIVDGGVGIKFNVNNYLRNEFNKNKSIFNRTKYKEKDIIESIKWAIKEGNSTTGKGGLGLSLLIELIKKSDGQLEIISENGYYSIKNNKVFSEILDISFQGTIISIGLDTDKNKFYYLQGEKQ